MTTNKRKWFTAVAGIAVVVLLLVGLFFYLRTSGSGQSGSKNVQIMVVLADGTQKEHHYRTDREYLGELLSDEKLAEGTQGQYGLYITAVDGVTADEQKEQWWCVTKAGESVMTGADTTPIADGDQFELTLTEGY